jgi:hypothetical protein
MSASRGLVLDALLEWLDLGNVAQVAQLSQSLNARMSQWRARQRSLSLRHLVGVSGGACRTLTVGLPGDRASWAWNDEVVGPRADAALRVVMRFYPALTTLDLTACLFTSQVLIDLSEACTKLQRIVDTESQWNRTILKFSFFDPLPRTEIDVGGYGLTLSVSNQLQRKRPGLRIERHAVRFEVYFADYDAEIDRSQEPIVMSLDECRPQSELKDAIRSRVGFEVEIMVFSPDPEGLRRWRKRPMFWEQSPLIECHREPCNTLSEFSDFRKRTPISVDAFKAYESEYSDSD